MAARVIRFWAFLVAFLVFSYPSAYALECYVCDSVQCNTATNLVARTCGVDPPTTTAIPTTTTTTTPASNITTPTTTTPASNTTTPTTTTPASNTTTPTTTTTPANVTLPDNSTTNATIPSNGTFFIQTTPLPAVHHILERDTYQTNYRCMKAEYTEGTTKKTKRDCVLMQTNENNAALCRKSVNPNFPITRCSICNSNRCNPAANLAINLAALMLPILLAVKLGIF